MSIHMKRWSEPKTNKDGYRLLICRSRPRGLPKEKESWDGWCGNLGPSPTLEADFRGAKGPPINFDEFHRRYLEEMKSQDELIDELARLVHEGKTITLLCSKTCKNKANCHCSVLKGLIEKRMELIARIKN